MKHSYCPVFEHNKNACTGALIRMAGLGLRALPVYAGAPDGGTACGTNAVAFGPALVFYPLFQALWRVLLVFLWLVALLPAAQAEVFSWSPAGSLSGTTQTMQTVTLQTGEVLSVGGNGTPFVADYLARTDLFDPGTGAWSAVGNMAQGRVFFGLNLLQTGKVLATAGYGPGFVLLNSAEVYDPITKNWSAAANLQQARRDHVTVTLADGRVLVAGGQAFSVILQSVEIYDPATDTWAWGPSLPVPLLGAQAVLLPATGRVLFMGGAVGPGTLGGAYIYDPVANSWSVVTSPAEKRWGHTLTLLPSGQVLAVGGTDISSATMIGNAEVYDPATNLWSPAGHLATPRRVHTATLLDSGKVLVVGGSKNSLPLSSAELYDPATGLWLPAGSTGIARSSHGAARLLNDRVLIFGGWDGSNYHAGAQISTLNWTASTAVDTHATISPSGAVPVPEGTPGVFTVGAQTGYRVTGVSGTCGGTLSGATFTTSAVIGDCSLSVASTINTYAIATTAVPVVGGSVTCSPVVVEHGGSATCIATPQSGYVFAAFGGDCSGLTCQLSNVQSQRSVLATFLQKEYAAPLPGTATTARASISGGNAGCALASAQWVTAASIGGNLPANANAALPGFRFSSTDCGASASITLKLQFPYAFPSGTVLYKYGPKTPGAISSTWFALPGATLSADGLIFTYTLDDNGVGDSNPAVGLIDDPVLPVPPKSGAQGIPTLSEWSLWILLLALGGLGINAVRRQNASSAPALFSEV